MPANYTEIEKRLWEAADELRANSKLKPSEYSVPVLGQYLQHCCLKDWGLHLQELIIGVGASNKKRFDLQTRYGVRCSSFHARDEVSISVTESYAGIKPTG